MNLLQPNLFRVVVQVMDLISLDLQYAKFQKARLSLAVVVLGLLQAYNCLKLSKIQLINDCHIDKMTVVMAND